MCRDFEFDLYRNHKYLGESKMMTWDHRDKVINLTDIKAGVKQTNKILNYYWKKIKVCMFWLKWVMESIFDIKVQ